MNTLTQTRMTMEEYLAWAHGRDGRYELVDGIVHNMSPERSLHAKTKGAIYIALIDAVRRAGIQCHIMPDGMTVRVGARTAYEPDALAYCGEEIPDDAMVVEAPVIVVEVLSESTRRKDSTVKAAGYFSLPSVAHYLIVDAEERTIEHRERDREPRTFRDGVLDLTPPGLTLAFAAVFQR